MSWQSSLRLAVLLGAGFGLTGCPLVLEDDFKTQPADAASGGNAANGMGGNAPNSGNNQVAGGDGPTAATGGVLAGGGKAGDEPGGNGPMLDGGAGGGAGEGGETEPCASCSANEQCCEGECVDTRFDSKNCRECGTGCPGTTCDNSSCTNTCALGSIDCNHNVVDGCEVNPAVDTDNCGNCGIVCGFGFVCVGGYCECPAGTADCDSNKLNGCEVDTSSDKGSCGMCFKACAANQACSNSQCDCAVGFDDCNTMAADGCEADLTAPGSCGSCGFDCGPHSTCVAAGQCGCVPGYLDCDEQVPGCETPATDSQHCGKCDVACDVATPVCDGTSCSDGCNGLTRCGDSCVDTDTDPENCGDCGQPVGLNQVCVAGTPECSDDFDDCDDDPTTCETNVKTDNANCSACGNACKPGAACNAGSCTCSPTTPNDCGSSCQQCCNDGQCSDGNSCTADVCSNGVCGAGAVCAGGGKCCSGTGCYECCGDSDCTNNKVCSSNQCITLTCVAPKIACGQKCVDPTNDANNCSGCGIKCGLGRSCATGSCTPKWVTMATPVNFANREKAAYTAMGSKVFIWGGQNAAGQALADGAIYDPETNTWTPVGSAGAPPSARVLATAVWTGSVVVVWGGGDVGNDNDYGTGSRYDPLTNSWTAITNFNAPSGRRAPYGFWTGSRVIYYAGFDHNGGAFSAPYLYDPVNNSWSNTDGPSRPPAYLNPTVSWTGTQLVVYGGLASNNFPSAETYVYDLAGDVWSHEADGPNARSGALGAWDGALLLAWSGINGNTLRIDGKVYDLATDKWTNVGAMNAPAARWAPHRQTGWSFRVKPRVTLMVGGYGSTSFRTDGGIYNSTTNAWSAVAAWPSNYSHLWGVSVWTGTELILWGGRQGTGATLTNAGERYFP